MILAELKILIATLVGGIIIKVLADDAKTFIPRLAQSLLRRAALRLGEEYSDSFYEEWTAHLIEIPETSGKIYHAASIYFWGANKIRRTLSNSRSVAPIQRISKRMLDIVLATNLIPAAILVVAACAIPAAVTGRSPLYSTVRIGRNGRAFRQWKLRTMMRNSHLTTVGRMLRKNSLDELPAIWNVLAGDMSLVGPRPMSPEQLNGYDGQSYLKLRPGFIGLHQNLGDDRARLDDEYYEKQSFWTDLKILLGIAIVTYRDPRK